MCHFKTKMFLHKRKLTVSFPYTKGSHTNRWNNFSRPSQEKWNNWSSQFLAKMTLGLVSMKLSNSCLTNSGWLFDTLGCWAWKANISFHLFIKWNIKADIKSMHMFTIQCNTKDNLQLMSSNIRAFIYQIPTISLIHIFVMRLCLVSIFEGN